MEAMIWCGKRLVSRTVLEVLACAMALSMVSEAQACSPVPDNRPLWQRLADVHTAFIGRVVAVNGRRATFELDNNLKAPARMGSVVVEMPAPSTCVIEFGVGQRWLFGGVYAHDPSVRLDIGPNGAKFDDEWIGRLRRTPDKALSLPGSFSRCDSDSQCVVLGYNCSETAVNRASLGAAMSHVFGGKKASRPEEVSCPSVIEWKAAAVGAPLCHANKCGVWSVAY